MDIASLTALISAIGGLTPIVGIVLIIGIILLAPIVLTVYLQNKFMTQATSAVTETFNKLNGSLQEIQETIKELSDKLSVIPVLNERIGHIERKIDTIEKHLDHEHLSE